MPGLRSIGSGYSSTNSLEVGRVQLRCATSGEMFLIVQFRVYSWPGLHSSHLISLQHSKPTLQGVTKFPFAHRSRTCGCESTPRNMCSPAGLVVECMFRNRRTLRCASCNPCFGLRFVHHHLLIDCDCRCCRPNWLNVRSLYMYLRY